MYLKKFMIAAMFALMATVSFIGCSDDDDDSEKKPEITYSIDTANVDYKGANRVIFYDFSSGTKTEKDHDIWDIAFDSDLNVVGNSGNYGTGVSVFKTSSTDIDEDFTEIAADTNTKFISTYADNNPLGQSWMDMSSMPPSYTNTVFLIETEDGEIYKAQFTGATMSGDIKLKAGTLNATGLTEKTVSGTSDYDYTYYDLGTMSTVDFAPPLEDWDVKFGRTEFVMGTSTGGRSSVSINSKGGVECCVVEEKNIDEVLEISNLNFSKDILTIGNGWYVFDHTTRTFSVAKNTNVLKTVEGNFAKFQIATFYGPNEESFWAMFEYLYQSDGAEKFSK